MARVDALEFARAVANVWSLACVCAVAHVWVVAKCTGIGFVYGQWPTHECGLRQRVWGLALGVNPDHGCVWALALQAVICRGAFQKGRTHNLLQASIAGQALP